MFSLHLQLILVCFVISYTCSHGQITSSAGRDTSRSFVGNANSMAASSSSEKPVRGDDPLDFSFYFYDAGMGTSKNQSKPYIYFADSSSVSKAIYKLNLADRTDIERIIGTGEDDNTINTFDATIGPNIRIDNKVSIICLDSNDTMYFAQNIDRGSYSSYSTSSSITI